MLNSRLAAGNRLVRVTVWAAVFLGLIVSAIILLPPNSRARLEVQPTSGSTQKRSKPEYVPGQVLVRYRSDSSAKRQQLAPSALSVAGRPVPIQVERMGGSDAVPGLRLAHVAPEDTMSAIAALKEQPDVLYAEPNYIMHADVTTPNDPLFTNTFLYGITKIGAPLAWDITQGSPAIVVGVIDQGIDISHPDLAANIWNNPVSGGGSFPPILGDAHGYSFVTPRSGTIPGEDHATHVAGTIGAVGNNAVGVVGVNWQVGLMSLRFLDGAGNGNDADAIDAVSYAKQMRDLWVSSGGNAGANIRVLNNSYGGGGFTQAMLDAIRAVNQSGILFVASEGNEGVDSDVIPHYPSGYDSPNVISVVATTSIDSVPGFSNFGAQTATMGAPGVGILSTTPKNSTLCTPVISTDANGYTYSQCSGTSMASPHVAGAAALLLSAHPDLTVQQVKALLMFNGDLVPSLNGLTVTGRRLNVFNSLQASNEGDVTPPGPVTLFTVTPQGGRNVNISWTSAGDDASTGNASLYDVSFIDSDTGVVVPIKKVLPSAPSTQQQLLGVKIPIGHSKGTIRLREFDNVGNEGTPVSQAVSINFVDGNPYAMALGKNAPLSTGGIPLTVPGTPPMDMHCDDCYRTSALPSFPFFGQNFTSVTVASNGNLYFTPPNPPTRPDPIDNADDVPSSVGALTNFKMISGLWDDLYLKTDQRADAGVYVVTPDSNTTLFRWQGVPCNDNGSGCAFGGDPVNFEIELRSNGIIQTRYGSGNTNLFPVVGISGGEPDAYVTTTHTSENISKNLTNARTVTYIPRAVMQPLDFADFFVTEQYRDFLSREPDTGGLGFWIDAITNCGTNQGCINTNRIIVSNEFFYNLEYQQTGAYVYRLYREAFGNNQPFPNPSLSNPTEGNKQPLYANFTADRLQVVGGPNLVQQQQDLANAFVLRPEFLARYPAGPLDQFVDAVLLTIKNDLCAPTQASCSVGSGPDLTSQKTALVALGSRGAVIYRLANDDGQGANAGIINRALIDAEYNRAFVYTQYAGYLRRNDVAGFLFWLNAINAGPLRDPGNQRQMVCVFVTSAEYQQRFSTIVTHFNSECP